MKSVSPAPKTAASYNGIMKPIHLVLFALCSTLAAGCSTDDTNRSGADTDMPDATEDAGGDSSGDVAEDAATDIVPDDVSDTSPDTEDATQDIVDAGSDAREDVADAIDDPDVTTDVSDSGGDTADAGADVADAGSDVDLPDLAAGPTWVGVGSFGRRAVTVDGAEWFDQAGPDGPDDHTPDLLRNVAYGDGLFVAVGGDANAMIMTSTDGVRWTEDVFPEGNGWLGGVTYVDGVWVAAGGNGDVVRSTDGGDTWGYVDSGFFTHVRDMTTFGSRVIGVGDGGLIVYSDDQGQTWMDASPGGIGMNAVAGGHGIVVAVGASWNGGGFDSVCHLSTDGASWSPCAFFDNTTLPVSDVAFGDGILVISAGFEGSYRTINGTDWTFHATGMPDSLAFTGDRWVGHAWQSRWTAVDLDDWTTAREQPNLRAIVGGVVD